MVMMNMFSLSLKSTTWSLLNLKAYVVVNPFIAVKIMILCISMAFFFIGRERNPALMYSSFCINTAMQTCLYIMHLLCDPSSGDLLPSCLHREAQMLCI